MYTSLQSTKTGNVFDKVIFITKHTENIIKESWTFHNYNIYYFKRCQNMHIYVLTMKSDDNSNQNQLFLNFEFVNMHDRRSQ